MLVLYTPKLSLTLTKMNLGLIFTCAVVVSVKAEFVHRDLYMSLCSDTDKEDMFGLDKEEMYHADFSQGKGVMTLPEFADPASYGEGAYQQSVANAAICKQNLDVCIKSYKNPAEPMNQPQSSIYSKDDVQLDTKNTLICHITGFYPPRVGVFWTKNNVNVTDEATLSRYYPVNDGNFIIFSTLSFTPKQGDIYTCSVQHSALEIPLTKTWDVKVDEPSVGPSVFCGVGLAAGLLGVATGTFFLIKGNQCK
ncbi:RLA class II histocompatibility antigen, DP alpha-1 chain-like [Electrophorus electricus]|uniref:RLA class II histocompatibility antigen, DP alpha-1 chain-like n=1 Tax=Electrophorus electricus TaxID=8005 RepID=UPI0015CFA793|nr:RLA class II histocompatibility antigen, DP alpha-1 chain-like [Electrophorus electricus]